MIEESHFMLKTKAHIFLVMEAINQRNQYFVIRIEDNSKLIYKDAKGLFDKNKARGQKQKRKLRYKLIPSHSPR